MIYDIVCPFCMERYPANNVVFRHDPGALRAAGRNVADYLITDPYRKAYLMRRSLPAGRTQESKVVDPAYYPEESKTYSNGLLIGLRCSEGYVMDERVCPCCHNKLYASAGRMPMQQMAIIGATSSGKTTFEAAMMYQLIRSGVGCINNTLNESGRLDDVVENNIQLLRQRSQQRLGKLQQGAEREWAATESYHGPYIFSVSPGQNAETFALAFYDLPGEQFRNNVNMIKSRAPYIGSARTCLCLIDLENIDSISCVIGTLNSNFGDEMKKNGVNLALVLYKADLLYETVKDIKEFVRPLSIGLNDPVDMVQIEIASKKLENFVISRDGRLQGAYSAICAMLGEKNVRLFMAQAFNDDGDFDPCGCEVPLLWSLARQGLYPCVG